MELEANSGFTISHDDFVQICPFYFCFDENIVVTDISPSVIKLFGNVLGDHLLDIISINDNSQGKIDTYKKITDCLNHSNYFNSKKLGENFRFKGQFCAFKKGQIILIFSPIIDDEANLKDLNLDYSDFASQDATYDYLIFLTKQKKEADITAYQEELLTANSRLNSLLNTMQSGVIAEDAEVSVEYVIELVKNVEK